MSAIRELIATHHREILDQWAEQAQRSSAARGLSQPDFLNIVPDYIRELGRPTPVREHRQKLLESFLSARLRQGFPLAEIIEDLAILGRIIRHTWPETAGLGDVLRDVEDDMVSAAEVFHRHMLQDEQADKLSTRLLQQIATEALATNGVPLRERLCEVLEVMMEPLGADAATVVLYDGQSDEPVVTGSCGILSQTLTDHAAVRPGALVGYVAAHSEAVEIPDVHATGLVVPEDVLAHGIRSLLAVRLSLHHALRGVLFVGFREKRTFTAREIRRLESFGERLTVHLDNAKLLADTRAHVADLTEERALRERFVSILAHDLRGPLSTARLAVETVTRRFPADAFLQDRLAKAVQNVDRVDRMIRDLLDVSRIHAGAPLELDLAEVDLVPLLHEVVTDLADHYGDRFRVEGDPEVKGIWSADELRRALWNLAANAVKYGADEHPIVIAVRNTSAGGASVTVTNWGNPISADDLRSLFRPFVRTESARASQRSGWGLGLALVLGCARAHGGSVGAESDETSGTTFTIELPGDARPFQPSMHPRNP